MFFNIDIKADALPPKTVCLTYDDGPGETRGDGPGPRTREIGRYLSERGIRATFFVVGRHAEPLGDLLGQLVAWGHLLGNHTYSHPGLVALAERGGDVVAEVEWTDRLIRRRQRHAPSFLRPPYGNWRQRAAPEGPDRPTSIVAERLNASPLAPRYVGPVNWDISGEDYDYWRDGRSAEECAARYLDLVDRRGRGIVLMHDSSEDAGMRSGNRTFEVTRLVVSALGPRGYRFIGLDEIPQVRSAARVSKLVALPVAGAGNLAVREGDDRLVVSAPDLGMLQQFGIVELGDGGLALRATNGRFVGLNETNGTSAVAKEVGPCQTWYRVPVGDGRTLLRDAGDRYLRLSQGADGPEVSATARRSSAAAFEWVDLFPNAARWEGRRPEAP
jgi:peptidoglycan/xylan/chitin deacetylase (PgdA/CDA1 family)